MKSVSTLALIISSLCASVVFASPNFNVSQDGRSLLITFKVARLQQRVINEVKKLYPLENVETIVIHDRERDQVVIQFFNFFTIESDEEATRTAIRLEGLLEGNLPGQAIETERVELVRLPFALTDEELMARRTEHVRTVVEMTRFPLLFTTERIFEVGIEGVEIPYDAAMREAINKAHRRAAEHNRALTRADVAAIVAEQNRIAAMRDEAVRNAQDTIEMQARAIREYAIEGIRSLWSGGSSY